VISKKGEEDENIAASWIQSILIDGSHQAGRPAWPVREKFLHGGGGAPDTG
jgi:hypothetical protein